MTTLTQPQDNLRAGLHMVAASAAFVTNDTFVKLLAGSVPVGQIIAVRGFMAAVLLGFICAHQNLFAASPLMFSRSVLARSAFDLVATFFFIAALMHIPIANLTSIIQTVPLAVIILAYLFLAERVGWRRLSAVVAGFIGVLLIAKPSPATFTIYDGLAVAIVFLAAVRDIITRRIPAHVPSLIIAFANALIVTTGGVVFGLFEGFVPLSFFQFGCLAAASLFLAFGYVCIVLTLRMGEISVSAPFRYSNVLFSIFSGVVVFGEVPDILALAGMALVVASGLYTIHRERMLKNIAKTNKP